MDLKTLSVETLQPNQWDNLCKHAFGYYDDLIKFPYFIFIKENMEVLRPKLGIEPSYGQQINMASNILNSIQSNQFNDKDFSNFLNTAGFCFFNKVASFFANSNSSEFQSRFMQLFFSEQKKDIKDYCTYFYANDKKIQDLLNASKSNNGRALCTLGSMIEGKTYNKDLNGNAITDNNRNQVVGHLFQQAVSHKNHHALYSLAIMIAKKTYDKDLKGIDISNDTIRNQVVGDLYRKAAKFGHVIALNNLAVIIENKTYDKDLKGNAITDNNRNEVVGDLLRQAAKFKIHQAFHNLARMIEGKTYQQDLNGNAITDNNRNQVILSLNDVFFNTVDSIDSMPTYVFLEIKYYDIDTKSMDEKIKFYEKLIAKIKEKFKKNDLSYIKAYASYLLKLDDAKEKALEALSAGHEKAFHLFIQVLNSSSTDNVGGGDNDTATNDVGGDNDTDESSDKEEYIPDAANEYAFSKGLDLEEEEVEELKDSLERKDSQANQKEIKRNNVLDEEEENLNKTKREALSKAWKEEKRIKDNVQRDKNNLTKPMTLSSSSFSQPSDKIEIIFSEKAREGLDKIKTKEVTERLPLLIETLKELRCCGVNKIEILKNVHQDGKKVYSGRLNHKDRLHAVRTIKDGRVTKIEILSILGHTK